MKAFTKWLVGMHGAPPPAHLVWTYQAASICQAFPAYRLDEVKRLPGSQVRDLLLAIELLNTARKVNG